MLYDKFVRRERTGEEKEEESDHYSSLLGSPLTRHDSQSSRLSGEEAEEQESTVTLVSFPPLPVSPFFRHLLSVLVVRLSLLSPHSDQLAGSRTRIDSDTELKAVTDAQLVRCVRHSHAMIPLSSSLSIALSSSPSSLRLRLLLPLLFMQSRELDSAPLIRRAVQEGRRGARRERKAVCHCSLLLLVDATRLRPTHTRCDSIRPDSMAVGESSRLHYTLLAPATQRRHA